MSDIDLTTVSVAPSNAVENQPAPVTEPVIPPSSSETPPPPAIGEQGKPEGEDDGEAEKPAEIAPAEDPQYQAARDAMAASGIDLAEMDKRYYSGEPLTDTELGAMATHTGHKLEDVKTVIGVKQENNRLQQLVQAQREKEAQAYASQLESLAGEGGITELKKFIETNAPESQRRIWNATLASAQATQNNQLLEDVLDQYLSFRKTHQATVVTPTPEKPADLSLLVQADKPTPQASPKKPETTEPPVEDPLAGNDLVGLHRQQLSQIQLAGTGHPLYEKAMAVIRALYPEQA